MPRLIEAEPAQVRAIYRESHALWGAGLSLDDYIGLWEDLRATAWARRHARFLVWQDDDGSILSSLKLYTPPARVLGREGRAAVLGAIFTPRELRRRGHATGLIAEVLRLREAAGDDWSFLFSDIGTDYYRGFGYEALRAEEQWGTLSRGRRLGRAADRLRVRDYADADLPDLMRAHEAFARTLPLAIVRDRDHWHFLRVRAESYFRRVADPAVRERVLVAEGEDGFVGYAFTVEGRGEWNLREVGAVDGTLQTMAAVLHAAGTDALRSGMRRFYGWLPPGLDRELDRLGWAARSGPRRRARPMVRGLAAGREALRPSSFLAGFIPYQDQF